MGLWDPRHSANAVKVRPAALGLLIGAPIAGFLLSTQSTVLAGEAAAIVEEVSDPANGVEAMEILEVGRVIELKDDATLTLGYLRSCIREMIAGGIVTVGLGKSRVENGTSQIETVDCDGGVAITPSEHGAEVAGTAFRKGAGRKRTWPKPNWTLHSTEPLLRHLKPHGRLHIERLDKAGEEPIELSMKGLVTDFSRAGVRLTPGGLYAMSVGAHRYIIKVSPLATPDAPLLSRLIVM